LNPTDLVRATMLTSGGITKRLDRMAEAGLIERRPDLSDRRGTLVRLTRRGKTIIDKAMAVHMVNEARLIDSLTTAQRRALEGLLRTLLVGLERM
jgi:DNA-binding MarR family transcriptional regulator